MTSSNGRDPRFARLDNVSDRQILKYLSEVCKYVVLRIDVEDIQPSTANTREGGKSDLGKLDKLPAELLDEILGHIDFRSLLQLSATSLLARSLVFSFPAYRDVMTHASKALNALARVGLLDHFSARTLHQMLAYDRCASCHGYGQFLHLLLGERACRSCLKHNPALWVLSAYRARKFFDLKQSHLNKLPALRRIPKLDFSGQHRTWKNGTYYSVKMLKKLALKLQGGPLEYERFEPTNKTTKSRLLKAHLRAAVVDDDIRFEPLNTAVGWHKHVLGEACYKMTAVSLCHMGADKAVSHGKTCRGCEWIADGIVYNSWFVSRDDIDAWVPAFADAYDFSEDVIDVARSKTELVEHVRGCTAIQLLLDHIGDSRMCLQDLVAGPDAEPTTSDEEDDFDSFCR